MPHYSYEKTFTAEGSVNAPEELEMPCAWGILTDVVIAFRFGTDRTTHVHIDDALHQIFPTNPKETYAFEGYTLTITDKYELLPDTRKIYLRGWNEGTYPHTIAVAFKVELPERFTPAENAIIKLAKLWEQAIYGSAKRST
jgi:hypothetical protein